MGFKELVWVPPPPHKDVHGRHQSKRVARAGPQLLDVPPTRAELDTGVFDGPPRAPGDTVERGPLP